jgi:hypothetical protein
VALEIEPNMYYLVTTAEAQTSPARGTVNVAGEETARHDYEHDGAYGGGRGRALHRGDLTCVVS